MDVYVSSPQMTFVQSVMRDAEYIATDSRYTGLTLPEQNENYYNASINFGSTQIHQE